MKRLYIHRRFSEASLAIVDKANEIIEDYTEQGYNLTLRQLYYQFVARECIENSIKSYKKLGDLISKGRLAGLIDWEAIIDRTREFKKLGFEKSARHAIEKARQQFLLDKWLLQTNYIEVWIEKEALIGVVQKPCWKYEVPYAATKGNPSSSFIYAAAKRLTQKLVDGKEVSIIYLGDHDPTGLDITRDIQDRLTLMCSQPIEVNRIALNMDQVNFYNPPPNPAKTKDSRAKKYIEKYGPNSWELDALSPADMSALVGQSIRSYMDHNLWKVGLEKERDIKASLQRVEDSL